MKKFDTWVSTRFDAIGADDGADCGAGGEPVEGSSEGFRDDGETEDVGPGDIVCKGSNVFSVDSA